MHCLIIYELVIKVYNLENWIFSTGVSFIYSGFLQKENLQSFLELNTFPMTSSSTLLIR